MSCGRIAMWDISVHVQHRIAGDGKRPPGMGRKEVVCGSGDEREGEGRHGNEEEDRARERTRARARELEKHQKREEEKECGKK